MEIAQIGVGGWGAAHLKSIGIMQARRKAVLRAVADPFVETMPELQGQFVSQGIPWFRDYREMLEAVPGLQAIVICTPIPLHEEMLIAVLEKTRGRILLEKPAVPAIHQLERLIAMDSERRVRIGFHMICWPHLIVGRKLISLQRIGRPFRITVSAGWPRGSKYYSRASWAGRLMLGDCPVFDGPATNALSHLLHNVSYLLSKAGKALPVPCRVRARCARARPIESYDTIYLEAEYSGVQVQCVLSHAVERFVPYVIRVEGDGGWLELSEQHPHLKTNFRDVVEPQYDNTSLPFYERFLGDAETFSSLPNSLVDVRPYTLLTNAALISSGGITTIPKQAKGAPLPDSGVEQILGLAAAMERLQRDPSSWNGEEFAWLVPGCWVEPKSIKTIDFSQFQ